MLETILSYYITVDDGNHQAATFNHSCPFKFCFVCVAHIYVFNHAYKAARKLLHKLIIGHISPQTTAIKTLSLTAAIYAAKLLTIPSLQALRKKPDLLHFVGHLF